MKLMHNIQHPTSGNQQFQLTNSWWLTSRSALWWTFDDWSTHLFNNQGGQHEITYSGMSNDRWSEPIYFIITSPLLTLLTNKHWQRSTFKVKRQYVLLKITEPSTIHFNHLYRPRQPLLWYIIQNSQKISDKNLLLVCQDDHVGCDGSVPLSKIQQFVNPPHNNQTEC